MDAPIGPAVVKGKEDGNGLKPDVSSGELGIGWTVAYYVLLFAGAYGFYAGLWSLTDSERSLASFGSVRK